MYRKKGAVYGRNKHLARTADVLWDEAITASPVKPIKRIITVEAEISTTLSHTEDSIENIPTVLCTKDVNIISQPKIKSRPKPVEVDLGLESEADVSLPLMASTPIKAVHTVFESDTSLSSVDIDDLETAFKELDTKSDIEKLLCLCDQQAAKSFEEYTNDLKVRKLGEASYSEVFLANDETVLKVIPFGEAADEVPIHDIIQEIRISRSMSDLEGFVKLKGVCIVKGLYPDSLLTEWDAWAREHESENDRPDWYKADQQYCIISLEHGGIDLEHVEIKSWRQAQSILLRIVEALARGEQERQFEHRDLHWGNVLVKPDDSINIIDYTLSRATTGDSISDVAYYGFADEAIFEAEGGYQFDMYRMMRSTTQNDWAGYHPSTNVLWLHYLVDKLLHAKEIKRPVMRKSKRTPVLDEDEIAAYSTLMDMLRLLDPHREYDDGELAIDSAERVLSLIV